MIHIYCLIDPRNKTPFYVGATKASIYVRLSNHINECKTYLPHYWSKKQQRINDILLSGNRPKTKLLHKCSIHETEHYELFFYEMFIQQGFELLQNKPAGYKSKIDSERIKKAKYISTRPLPIIYNNPSK